MSGENKIILSGKQVTIGYRDGKKVKSVCRGLDFELRSGELTCLLGANGAGKSTLLRTLAANQPPLAGQVNLLGKPLADFSERERSKSIGVVLTDGTQAGGLSVFELVGLGRQPHTGFFGRLNQNDRQIIHQAMRSVGIEHKSNNFVAELSDGERQKAMIAKALVQECPLILLDEPTAFLDVVSRIEVMMLLHRIAAEENRSILLSTHDVEQALVLGDRLWVLTDKHELRCGVTEDIVLSGTMDALFSENDIKFDKMHGIYSPKVQGGKRIRLQAADEVLLHWAQNALNRHDFLCLAHTEETAMPCVDVVSPHEIVVTAAEQRIRCSSFAKLIETVHSLPTPQPHG